MEILLHPERVRLVTFTRGQRVVLADLGCSPLAEAPPWQAAIDALKHWLSGHPLPTRTRVTVRLSGQLIRYAVLPWSDELITPQEEQALSRLIMESIYGDPGRDGCLALAPARYGQARLLAAIDDALSGALTELLPKVGLTVRPQLTATLEAIHDQLPPGKVQLAVIEPGLILFLGLRDRQLTRLRPLRIGDGEATDLSALLRRQAWLDTDTPEPVSLCYCDTSGTFPPVEETGITRLVPTDGAAPARYDRLIFGRVSPGRARRAGWAGLLLSGIVLFGVVQQQAELSAAVDELRSRQLRQSAPAKPPPLSPDAQARQRKLDAIRARLDFPWGGLLKTLETSVGDDIALLAVEPDPAHHQVRIEAEARNWDAMIEYIGRLDGEGLLIEAHLVSHRVERTDPQAPVRFVVEGVLGKGGRLR